MPRGFYIGKSSTEGHLNLFAYLQCWPEHMNLFLNILFLSISLEAAMAIRLLPSGGEERPEPRLARVWRYEEGDF